MTATPSVSANPRTELTAVMYSTNGRDRRDDVGGDDRVRTTFRTPVRTAARGVLPPANLVLQSLEEHDVGVGRDAE